MIARLRKNSCADHYCLTPIFLEKVIEEIQPGNPWNDVLYLVARHLVSAGGWYPSEPLLQSKRHLVPHPDGGKEVLEPFVVVSKKKMNYDVERGLDVPVQIFRLLEQDLTGIDLEDEATIDAVFAEWVVLGPGFYRTYLAGKDCRYGDQAIFRIPMGVPPQVKQFEGRVLRGKARLVPLVADEFEPVLAGLRAGKIRRPRPWSANSFTP